MSNKLLFIAHTDNLRGGGELSLVELLKAAKKRNYKPHVVVPGDGEFVERVKQLGVGSTVIRYHYWGKEFSPKENAFNILAISKIAKLIQEQNYSCVITNTLMIPWGALAAAMTNTPHIWITRELLTLHHAHLHDHYDFIQAYSNLIFANSKDNANYLKKEIGLKNVSQFYSYVDTTNLHLNSRLKTPRIVYIAARIHPDKDQLELVKALVILEKKKQLNTETILIGSYSDDEYFKKVNAFILSNNLEKKVRFAGYNATPFEMVGPNDIFVRSSKHESLGRAITEAMKLGLICVAADIDSSKEAFELGGGTLYKAGQPEDLAAKLQKILSSPEDYAKAAVVAKEKALKNLSEGACHKPFFTQLPKIIDQPNPRRELKHILPNLANVAESIEHLDNMIDHYRRLSDNRRQTLEDIINSKSWKTILFARKILRR